MLIPRGDWIPSTKLREILQNNDSLEEVLLTVELCGRLEKLVEVVGFDLILTYLNLLACLIESGEQAKTKLAVCIVIALIYHGGLAIAGRVVYNDIHLMGYPHLKQRYKILLGQPVKGSTYLLLLTTSFVAWALLCTVSFRLVLLQRI